MRTRALWAAALLLFAAPALLAFRSGVNPVSQFEREQTLAAGIALAVLALLAATQPWPLVPRGLPLLALAAMTAFAGWTALSLLWAPLRGDAQTDVQRVVLYGAAFAAALIATRDPALRRAAPVGLLAAIVLVGGYALGYRLLPALHDPVGDLLPALVSYDPGATAGDRLDAPLAYWNALGVLMAIGCLLALALASDATRARRLRALACGAAVPCGAALYLTLSRGSVLALGAGLIVLLLVRPRAGVLVSTAAGMGGALACVVALQAFPALTHLARPEHERADQGYVFVALMLIFAAAAGMIQALAARGDEDAPGRLGSLARADGRRLPLAGRPTYLIAAAAALAVVAVGAWTATREERPEGDATAQSRLASAKTVRGPYWEVALASFADNPVAGVGTAGFRVEWRRERDDEEFAADAHSLYLETLAELGLVGGLLLAALFSAVVAGLARRRRGDPLLAAAAPALTAFAVHAGLDWDWEWAAVVLPVLILAAAVLSAGEAAPDNAGHDAA